MRDAMRVTTIQRNLAADLLQIQPAEASLTPLGCDMKEQMARDDRAARSGDGGAVMSAG